MSIVDLCPSLEGLCPAHAETLTSLQRLHPDKSESDLRRVLHQAISLTEPSQNFRLAEVVAFLLLE